MITCIWTPKRSKIERFRRLFTLKHVHFRVIPITENNFQMTGKLFSFAYCATHFQL